MNLTPPQARAMLAELRSMVERDAEFLTDGRQIVVAPPFVSIPAAAETLAGSPIKLGAQNMHFEQKGAFTGEVSAPMLIALGVAYVIIGHSERRQLFGEDDDFINRKIRAALAHHLRPILCVGETQQQRDAGRTTEVVLGQLGKDLEGVVAPEMERIVLAYEPVWAIGTGRNATPGQAQEVHHAMRSFLRSVFPVQAETVQILYGGSVTPENIGPIVAEPDIDGALVGGASLKADSFARIAGVRLSKETG
jgi:triosephosphate isomerase (TIM)